jgi:hypothetical protein
MSSDSADGEASPLDELVPDDFLDTWGAATYTEALKKAEQAPTTTPEDELPRCPVCGTQRVYPRGVKGSAGQAREYDSDYVCSERHHFDDPVYGDPDDLDLDDEGDDTAGEPADPFVWVDEEDLAEPPLTRQLQALDDDTLAALAIYCYRPWGHTEADPSYRELGRIFPYSRDWVGERVREWKRGEHREKVADPRPPLTTAAGAEGVAAE